MRTAHAGHPLLLKQYLSLALTGTPLLVFDFTNWGTGPFAFTALVFAIVNRSTGDVVVTPEISPDGQSPVTVGAGVPAALTVPASQASWDQYGTDLIAPWWRLWVTGTGTCDVYVFAIPRGTMAIPELT